MQRVELFFFLHYFIFFYFLILFFSFWLELFVKEMYLQLDNLLSFEFSSLFAAKIK